MKITTKQLRKMIKEEKAKLLREASIEVDWAGDLSELQDLPSGLSGIVVSQSGPGGGWPVVSVEGPSQPLEDWYVNVYSGGDRSAARDFQEFVSESRLVEEKSKMLNENFGMESLNQLVAFGEAWSGLGSAVGEQILELVNAYIEGRMEDVMPDLNPNAIRLAHERLSYSISTLEGDDAETLKEALEQALEMMKQ